MLTWEVDILPEKFIYTEQVHGTHSQSYNAHENIAYVTLLNL
jgi:hypothetical protein